MPTSGSILNHSQLVHTVVRPGKTTLTAKPYASATLVWTQKHLTFVSSPVRLLVEGPPWCAGELERFRTMVLVGDQLFRYRSTMLLAAVLIEDGNDVGFLGIDHVDSITDLPHTTVPAL